MRCTRTKKLIHSMLAVAALVLVAWAVEAAEVEFPVPAYTPEELAKVREWEKTWVGKKIDKSTIDQVAEFLPECIVGMFKEQEKWGAPAEGFFFYILPYKQIIETTGMIEATKKYAPLVKTDAEGMIVNYAEIAGMPFPKPTTGQQVAYNFECQTRGDTYRSLWKAPNINPRTKTDRFAEQTFDEMFYIHRVDVDPRPAIAKNPDGFHKGQLMHMYLPPEMLNTRFLTMRFIDPKKEDLTYLWYSQFRRIRRLSSAERTNAIDGTDQIYDDGYMWDGHLSRNKYELKGKKERLLARHQEREKVVRQTGQGLINGIQFERCNTYVVEVINKDPKYLYSKRVWYLDPETYHILWQEIYDQSGRFWKLFIHMTSDIKTAKGDMKNFFVGYVLEDYQRTHSGYSDQKPVEVGGPIDPNIYTLSNLQKTY